MLACVQEIINNQTAAGESPKTSLELHFKTLSSRMTPEMDPPKGEANKDISWSLYMLHIVFHWVHNKQQGSSLMITMTLRVKLTCWSLLFQISEEVLSVGICSPP